MKKGFTLIELLAVIIILAIIALIATPAILNVVNNARVSARKSSVAGFADATKLRIEEYQFENKGALPNDINNLAIVTNTNNVTCECKSFNKNIGVILSDCTVGDDASKYYYISGHVYDNVDEFNQKTNEQNIDLGSSCSVGQSNNISSSTPTYTGGTGGDAISGFDNSTYNPETDELTIYTVNYVTSTSTTGVDYSIILNNLPVNISEISSIDVISSSVMNIIEDFHKYSEIKANGDIEQVIPTYSNWAKATDEEMLAHSATSNELTINDVSVTCNSSNCIADISESLANLTNIPFHETTTNGGDALQAIYIPIKFTIKINQGPVVEPCFTYTEPTPESCFTFDSATGTITGYDEATCGDQIVIPAMIGGVAVTNIGEYIISYNTNIIEVIISNGITAIGDSAFEKSNLSCVTIPNSVTSIGVSAFYDNKLTSLIIPNSVTSINNYAFDTNQLTSVTIGNGVTSIGEWAFNENQLTSIVIPDNVVTISPYAFAYNPLDNVIIGNGVTSIGEWAFQQNQITSLTLGNSLETIGNYAFDTSQIMSLTIPNSVISIGEGAFECNQITSLTLGTGITNIGVCAFYDNKLTSVTIPNSVTTVGGYAFNKNYIQQGNATIDNTSGSVTIDTEVFNNNGSSQTTTITPVYLR